MLEHWICHPLKDIDEINERLLAIEDIQNIEDGIIKDLIKSFSKLPDLERIISRIHADSTSTDDTVFFGDQESKKLLIFLQTLENFKKINEVIIGFSENEFKSKLLKRYSLK
jgi:DNA mismatch repair ATPase MutS